MCKRGKLNWFSKAIRDLLNESNCAVGHGFPGQAKVTNYSYKHDTLGNRDDTVAERSTNRTFTYDAAGNTTYDNRSGTGYGYTYDALGRMASFAIDGVVQAEYKYNAEGQQVVRTLTQTKLAMSTALKLRPDRERQSSEKRKSPANALIPSEEVNTVKNRSSGPQCFFADPACWVLANTTPDIADPKWILAKNEWRLHAISLQ